AAAKDAGSKDVAAQDVAAQDVASKDVASEAARDRNVPLVRTQTGSEPEPVRVRGDGLRARASKEPEISAGEQRRRADAVGDIGDQRGGARGLVQVGCFRCDAAG